MPALSTRTNELLNQRLKPAPRLEPKIMLLGYRC